MIRGAARFLTLGVLVVGSLPGCRAVAGYGSDDIFGPESDASTAQEGGHRDASGTTTTTGGDTGGNTVDSTSGSGTSGDSTSGGLADQEAPEASTGESTGGGTENDAQMADADVDVSTTTTTTGGTTGGSSSSSSTGGIVDSGPTPLDAAVSACPMVINGSLDSTDPTQVGRHNRFAPAGLCGSTPNKPNPGNAADPSNPHYFDLYRFSNPSASTVCYTFTLTYPSVPPSEAGTDAEDAAVSDGPIADTSTPISDARADAEAAAASEAGSTGGSSTGTTGTATTGGSSTSSSTGSAVPPPPQKYMTAYTFFDPTNIQANYLGDVGAALTSPQSMVVVVPPSSTIDVVIYAVDSAPAGLGSYTLSCATQ